VDDAQLARRFAALEAQVKLLSDEAGLACPPFAGVAAGAGGTGDGQILPATSQMPDEVVALARAGKTTQAISAYRRLTGATLLEAKRTIEGL
jgi:ribosomal protein L7/L12